MTDRELLEAAAKAAGLEVAGLADKMVAQPGAHAGGFVIENERGGHSLWNPLTDDGDALRLAVRLFITPHIDCNLTEAEWATQGDGGFIAEPHVDDRYAATRRAIVRAAAAMAA